MKLIGEPIVVGVDSIGRPMTVPADVFGSVGCVALPRESRFYRRQDLTVVVYDKNRREIRSGHVVQHGKYFTVHGGVAADFEPAWLNVFVPVPRIGERNGPLPVGIEMLSLDEIRVRGVVDELRHLIDDRARLQRAVEEIWAWEMATVSQRLSRHRPAGAWSR